MHNVNALRFQKPRAVSEIREQRFVRDSPSSSENHLEQESEKHAEHTDKQCDLPFVLSGFRQEFNLRVDQLLLFLNELCVETILSIELRTDRIGLRLLRLSGESPNVRMLCPHTLDELG
jgi:hypothetical protein